MAEITLLDVLVYEAEQEEEARRDGRPLACSCGNIVALGKPGTRWADRLVLAHPACGREPNRVRAADR